MLRIASVFEQASICMRCQYRLNLWRRLRSKHHPKILKVRQFSACIPVRQEGSQLSGADIDDGPFSKPIIRYDPYESPYRSRQLDKKAVFIPTKNSLGFDSLGQPAEVLILRDRSHEDERVQSKAGGLVSEGNDEASAEAISSSGMLEEMDAERGIIEMDQVCSNIDAIRDEWSKNTNLPWETVRSVAAKRYDDVAKKLHTGFTANQLAAYLSKNSVTLQKDSMDLHSGFAGSLYARSSWSPGTTDLWQIKAPEISQSSTNAIGSSRSSHNGLGRQSPRKRELVDEIMQHCWQLRPKKDESLLGEVDIRLHPVHLELIVKHKRGILKQISDTYGAKVEASTQDQAIRITSDYETSVDVTTIIIDTLENIQTSTLDLPAEVKLDSQSLVSQKHTRDLISREVMQSTNTILEEIKDNPSGRQLRIHYLGPDDEDIEDARRLIGQSLRVSPTKERKILLGRNIRKSRDLLVPIDPGNGLSLTDRSQQWSRWCSRSIREVNVHSKKIGSATRLNTLENPLDQREIARALTQFFVVSNHDYDVALKTKPHWMSNVTYWDSTVFGQVLFPTNDSKSEEATYEPGKGSAGIQPKLKQSRRAFSTMVPGLLRTLENLGIENFAVSGWDEEFLVIRLIPSFNNALSIPLEVLPDLEIRIQFDTSEKTIRIRDVRLVRKNELDLLLPQNTMDLRFIRQTCVYSRKNGLDERIQKFIADSNLEIWGTSRLRTPSRLRLSIPPHSLGPIMDGRTSSGIEHEEIEYTFASLEHKCEIGVPFRQPGSWADLTYTSIEAGKIGGRRDELALKQPRGPRNNLEADDDGVQQAEANVDDEHHSASLLRKANALISSIENPVDDGIERAEYGVGETRARPRKVTRGESQRNDVWGSRTNAGIRMVPTRRIRKTHI